jgi:hypothetical protein
MEPDAAVRSLETEDAIATEKIRQCRHGPRSANASNVEIGENLKCDPGKILTTSMPPWENLCPQSEEYDTVNDKYSKVFRV